MNQLSYEAVKDEENLQFVDLRGQHAFQENHIKGSLNLNLKNYGKYAANLLDDKAELVLVIDEDSTHLLEEFAENYSTEQVRGYVRVEEVDEEDRNTVETVAPEEFLGKDGDYILLDVRHPDEITRPAPKKNLVNIPLENLNAQLDELDHSKEIYTLCGSGNRATTTASYLKAHDFNPTVIEGGMKELNKYKED